MIDPTDRAGEPLDLSLEAELKRTREAYSARAASIQMFEQENAELRAEVKRLREALASRSPETDNGCPHPRCLHARGGISHARPAQGVKQLESQLAEAHAQLQWIGECILGQDVSEFAESFPLIRAVADLKALASRSSAPTPTEEGQ